MTKEEQRKEYAKQYYSKNRERLLLRMKKRYQENRTNIRTYKKREYALTPNDHFESRLKSVYKLSLNDYDKLYFEQNGKCAVCLKEGPNRRGKGKKTLAVDHCHTTGKVRGLLCTNCNTALGLLKEKPEIINSLLNYINNKNMGLN